MRWTSSQRTTEIAPYSLVAEFYDHLMRHVNYERWASYVMSLFPLADDRQTRAATARARVTRVLELACGTGQMLVELAKAGFTVFGSDRSAAMLRVARQRLMREGRHANLWCGDMREVAAVAQVDAAICLYDSINYCLTPEDLQRVFKSVAQLVRAGGLFIFDICTQHNCSRNFRNYIERDATSDFSYTRHAYYKAYKKLQFNDFKIIDETNREQEYCERHIQRVYSIREMSEQFMANGLWQEVGRFSGMSRRPGQERAERVHFVLKRNADIDQTSSSL